MPTLNRYAPGNEKTGFYIRANIGGQHPITLQVTPIAARIFSALDYSDGDAIPTKIVWAMYDLDMVYTLSSLDPNSTPDSVNPGAVLAQLDINAKLTDEERAALISYLESYSGPDAERVAALKEQLKDSTSVDALARNQEELVSNSYPEIPTTENEIKNTLDRWTTEKMTTRARKACLLCDEFVTASVRKFAAHNQLTETPLVAIKNKELIYELEAKGPFDSVRVADARGSDDTVKDDDFDRSLTYEYRIRRVYTDGATETGWISDNQIIKYDHRNGSQGSRWTLRADLDSLLPPNHPQTDNQGNLSGSAARLTSQYLSRPKEQLQENLEKYGHPIRL